MQFNCERSPLSGSCPDISEGELVITEIRKSQSDGDADWIEVYNSGNLTLDLLGLGVVSKRLDGSAERELIVYDLALSLDPKQYALVRSQAPDFEEVSSFLYDSGAIALSSCDQEIDATVYRNLTNIGTRALSGEFEPDAMLNDDELKWCVQGDESNGFAGTPAARNDACEI